MKWNELKSEAQLNDIDTLSVNKRVLIYKHSGRCAISASIKGDLESGWRADMPGQLVPYFLDVIRYQPLAQQVSERYQVRHESPQALLISEGRCIYHRSNCDINPDDFLNAQIA